MPVRVQQRLLEHFVAGTTARATAQLVRVQGRSAVVFFQRLRQRKKSRVRSCIAHKKMVPGMTIDLYITRNGSRHLTNLDGQTNRRTKASEHIDERIGTEEVNTPAEKIADARLSHA